MKRGDEGRGRFCAREITQYTRYERGKCQKRDKDEELTQIFGSLDNKAGNNSLRVSKKTPLTCALKRKN
jgi:hypothetical protein